MASLIDMTGFAILNGVVNAAEVARLIGVAERLGSEDGRRGGVRNLLDVPEMVELASSNAVRELVAPVLGDGFFPVRGILFDKTDAANWKVPWHQDMTIAVRERVEVAGFGPWSVKSAVVHVQPPAEVLEEMLTVRVHLDDCPAENGALRVISGTHLLGKVSAVEAARLGEQGPAVTCEVGVGGALLMRPLLVHASSAALRPGHRRVIHFDFVAKGLLGGLEWAAVAG